MKVLIVEDDSASRELLRSLTAQMGHSVMTAADGEEAWEIFQTEFPWLVISDWRMPRMDGLELCERIRACEVPHYTHFILVTAYAELRDDYLKIMAKGVDDFLRKPIDLEDLAIRLKVADRMANYQSRIRSLESIITICAYTKRVKIAEHTWQRIEDFIENNLGLQITHGVDPEYYHSQIEPELERLKNQQKLSEKSRQSN